ncbi:MAG TPA: ABC transporter ATP-binding protein [Candidatus Paceibacterota bacterium]|nr:ABC transporter ATP-binding protein [Candidatus Paceibacterota bacterium]
MTANKTDMEPHVEWRKGFAALWELAGSEQRGIIFFAALALISGLGNGAVPYVTGRLFDALSGIAGTHAVAPGVYLVFGAWALVQVVTGGVDWFNGDRFRYIENRMQMQIQMNGILRLLRLPMEYHKRERMSELMETISRAGWMCTATIRSITDISPQLLAVAVGITFAFTINPLLAWVLVAGALAYCMMLWQVVRGQAAAYRDAHARWNRSWGDAAAAAEHVDTVKAFATEGYEEEKARRDWMGETFARWMHVERIWSFTGLYQRVIVLLVQGIVLGASIMFVSEGALTIGQLVAFNGYALMFLGPFVSFGYGWQQIQNGLIAATRYHDQIMSQPLEAYEPEGAQPLPALGGDVSFEGVTFRYGDAESPVLRDITFHAKEGETIALVGASGGGKSTIIGLLLGFYFPSEGKVAIDGIDTRRLNLAEYRAQTAMVPQEVALFNDTIRMNIAYGSFGASDEQVARAVAIAQAGEFIERLPKGYETVVGERGVKLSVGQKQRLAVARAALRNPRILILDEPTSALDARTERALTGALEELMAGRTTFIIAHRLSTVRKADRILVLKDGRIVEQGTHEELIAIEGGVYRELYDHQVGLHA